MNKIFQCALIFTLTFFSLASGAFGQWGIGPGMMGWGYGMGWLGMILMAAFWIAVIAGVIFLIRWLIVSPGTKATRSSEESPLEILKKRYARGEINKDEFEGKKKGLGY